MNSILIVTSFLALFTLDCASIQTPSSCAELLIQGNTQSGIYTIFPKSWYSTFPFRVYCDMETDGGGWTLLQRRDDYEIRENFYRNWHDYKIGFGHLDKEFWLGNQYIYYLTNQDHTTLRVDLGDFEGNSRKAEYSQFQILNEDNNYKIVISGYHGDAGDSLALSGAIFTTLDRNDENSCSKVYKGGWWYSKCHTANLNGLYLKGNHSSFADGIEWKSWLGYHYSLKITEMKIRPTNFSPQSH
uniref:Fibrinogen C-terminal domain-containing protein n=1 Tax=Strigamia maritima TaxID=126957 RepID=T1JG82_STRMM